MKRMEIQDEETINKFDRACRQFGVIYREYMKKDATPKLHWLERHCPILLRRFKRLGPYREDPVEHQHSMSKRERIKASNIRNFFQSSQLQGIRQGASNIPKVASAIKILTDCKKRKRSNASMARQEAKDNGKKRIKAERLGKADNVININNHVDNND
jgi:hypothetical protein